MEQKKYEVQRAIRFELAPMRLRPGFTENMNGGKMERLERLEEIRKRTEELSKILRTCTNCLANLFYSNDGVSSGGTLRSSLGFRGKWISQILKAEWHAYIECEKSKPKDPPKKVRKVKDFDIHSTFGGPLKEFIAETCLTNESLTKELESIAGNPDHALARVSDIADIAGRISSRAYFGHIFALILEGYLKDKNDSDIIESLENPLKELREAALGLAELAKPFQSSGFPVEHVSLNYWTVNKLSGASMRPDSSEKDVNEVFRKFGWKSSQQCESAVSKAFPNWRNMTCKALYDEMKRYKALQKSALLEQAQKGVRFENVLEPFDYVDNAAETHANYKIELFSDVSKINYDWLLNITKNIETKSAETNQWVQSGKSKNDPEYVKMKGELQEMKKNRGGNFFFGKKAKSQQYQDFCEAYKQVAMDYGKRRANKFSTSRAETLALRERGYGIFSEDANKNRYLNAFPEKTKKRAMDAVKNGKAGTGGEITAFVLDSITLRALDKLCFGKDSRFAKNLCNKIDRGFTEQVEWDDHQMKTVLKKRDYLESNELLVPFYCETLEKADSLNIRFRSPESVRILRSAKTVEEFEVALKLETYVLSAHSFTNDEFQRILSDCEGNQYRITSWDLREDRDHPEQYTEWWKTFWGAENSERKFPLRINPEMTVSYIAKDWESGKDGKGLNRRYRDRYVLTMTISHHADAGYVRKSYIEDSERQNDLVAFNRNYNECTRLPYVYGIDKGTNELLTLGIFKQEDGVISPLQLDSEGLKILRITPAGLQRSDIVTPKKEGGNTVHTLHKNPSIYLSEYAGDASTFEQIVPISVIGDLTYAKVISGYVVLNGDINTVLKLALTAAKREIYLQILEKANRLEKGVEYSGERNEFFIADPNGKNGETHLCYLTDEFKTITDADSIRTELNGYVETVRRFAANPKSEEMEDVSIEKIGHLRSSLCADMVGVIAKLQESYPGYVAMEALDSKTLHSHFLKNHGHLANMVNEKLYNRFQMTHDVPLILKKFRSDIFVNGKQKWLQHGKVAYVNKEGTSTACPACQNTLFGHGKGPENERSMRHDPAIPACSYHMRDNPMGFEFLGSGDELATYNIAKRCAECLKNEIP